MKRPDKRPLILHVIHHLLVGGMENGLVNLINRLPAQRFRHAIACVEDFSGFRGRIERDDVDVLALQRSRVGVWKLRREFFNLCRRLNPAIVHTRNMSSLDALLPARLAGIKCCIHGEHGRDVEDLHGDKLRPAVLRRLHSPLVSRYVTVSRDLRRYLIERVGIAPRRIEQIYNGVDVQQFAPGPKAPVDEMPPEFMDPQNIVIGCVGRMQPVKDQLTLVRAFAELVRRFPEQAVRARLAIVGTGPLYEELRAATSELGIAHKTWLPGTSNRIARVLRNFDVFVLPSLSEGISNTVLEAMATGLPIVATAAGGNLELIVSGKSGRFFDPGDAGALTRLLAEYLQQEQLRRAHGAYARKLAVERFGIDTMVDRYRLLYEFLSNSEQDLRSERMA
jgi:sugar transferase (PEP-CTERM/EpsH1 system associated)